MALRTTEVFEVGKQRGEVGIIGGPNDWDMWLCLRGTTREVCFYTDQPVRVLPAGNAKTFFAAKITSMKRAGEKFGSEWLVEGRIKEYESSYSFAMFFNINTRKGKVTF